MTRHGSARRRAAAALLGVAAAAAVHAQVAQVEPGATLRPMPGARPFVLPPAKAAADPAQVAVLLDRAEAALAAGDASGAQVAFEQAAALRHTADIEVGWVRTQMQAGEYRRALSFAAHTAGAHVDSGTGAALYAWLLHVGGQPAQARTLLANAAQRLPDDPAIADVRSRIESLADPGTPWRGPRLAPYAQGAQVDPQARVAGSGVLVADGRLALVPSAWIKEGDRVWLRDGLGRTRSAALLRDDAVLGLALLRVDAASEAASPPAAPRDAFPGSPTFAIGYVGATAEMTQWPLMTLGFLGMHTQDGTGRLLGFDLPRAATGGPVFDAGGRWVGITVPGEDGRPRLVSASTARSLWDARTRPGAAVAGAAHIAVDELYERALRVAVQVIVASCVPAPAQR